MISVPRSFRSAGLRLMLLVALLGAVAVVAPAVTQTPNISGAAAGSPCPYSGGHPTLSRGATGDAVEHAQCLLNLWGNYGLAEDGIFGGNTEAAVRSIQADWGIVVDGDIGPCTWQALHPDSVPDASCYPGY